MEKKSEKHVLSFFVNLLLVILTFISTIYLGVFINSKRTLDSELENRGRSIVDSIVMARNWGAHYGGVYVEKSPGVISNPYLKNPDFEAVDGRIYTKKIRP